MYKDIFLDRKAVCFDLDGTIVDTHPLWVEAHKKVLREYENGDLITPTDYWTPGVDMVETWRGFFELFPDYNKIDTAENLAEKTYTAFLGTLEEYTLSTNKGFWKLAAHISEDLKLLVALVTNTPRRIGEAILENIGLKEILDFKIFGDEVSSAKPNPEMYYTTMEKLDLRPIDVVAFEDSIAGAVAAAEAHIDLVLILNEEANFRRYPGNILFFDEDFVALSRNIDQTYKEAILGSDDPMVTIIRNKVKDS
jgi:HAD superfamily hydrolase (TIGR01509 family)